MCVVTSTQQDVPNVDFIQQVVLVVNGAGG